LPVADHLDDGIACYYVWDCIPLDHICNHEVGNQAYQH